MLGCPFGESMPQEVQKLLCDVLVEIETTGRGRREREICGELWVFSASASAFFGSVFGGCRNI